MINGIAVTRTLKAANSRYYFVLLHRSESSLVNGHSLAVGALFLLVVSKGFMDKDQHNTDFCIVGGLGLYQMDACS